MARRPEHSPRWWNRPWRFPRMVDLLPEAALGNAEISHWSVDRDMAESLCYERCELWLPGTYCCLKIDGFGWMHDIPEEWRKNRIAVDEARGDVLIVGLGLGMILHPILARPEVERVHVLELNPNVRDLVMPSLDGVPGREKLTLEMADGLAWAPEARRRFDAIWLDAVPFYSPQSWFIDLAWKWEQRYRPFLREPHRSFLGHWALMEMLQRRLDEAYGKPRRKPTCSDLPQEVTAAMVAALQEAAG